MQRQAGVVERLAITALMSAEVSKCRAVLGTEFAGGRGERNGRMVTGGLCGAASVGMGARTERVVFVDVMLRDFMLLNNVTKSSPNHATPIGGAALQTKCYALSHDIGQSRRDKGICSYPQHLFQLVE